MPPTVQRNSYVLMSALPAPTVVTLVIRRQTIEEDQEETACNDSRTPLPFSAAAAATKLLGARAIVIARRRNAISGLNQALVRHRCGADAKVWRRECDDHGADDVVLLKVGSGVAVLARGEGQPLLANAPPIHRVNMRKGTKLPPTTAPAIAPPLLDDSGGDDGGGASASTSKA